MNITYNYGHYYYEIYEEDGNEIEGIVAIVNKTMPARKEVSIETKTGI